MNITINIKDGEIKQPTKAGVKKPRLVRAGRTVATPSPVRPLATDTQQMQQRTFAMDQPQSEMQPSRTAFPIASRSQPQRVQVINRPAAQPRKVTARKPSTARKVATGVLKSATPWGGARAGLKVGKKLFKKFKRNGN